MGKGVNKVFVLGNVGKDPVIKYTTSGLAMAEFALATTESWKDKNTGEKTEHTEWHLIEAYGKVAEICEKYVKKGSKVHVEGKLRTKKWENKETGQKRNKTVIILDELELTNSKQSSSEIASIEEKELEDNDIPF